MSALVDVSATFDAAGRAQVRLGGAGGAAFVSGPHARTVSHRPTESGPGHLPVPADRWGRTPATVGRRPGRGLAPPLPSPGRLSLSASSAVAKGQIMPELQRSTGATAIQNSQFKAPFGESNPIYRN